MILPKWVAVFSFFEKKKKGSIFVARLGRFPRIHSFAPFFEENMSFCPTLATSFIIIFPSFKTYPILTHPPTLMADAICFSPLDISRCPHTKRVGSGMATAKGKKGQKTRISLLGFSSPPQWAAVYLKPPESRNSFVDFFFRWPMTADVLAETKKPTRKTTEAMTRTE